MTSATTPWIGMYIDLPGHIRETDDGVDAANCPPERFYRIAADVVHLDREGGSGPVTAEMLEAASVDHTGAPTLLVNALGSRRFDEIEEHFTAFRGYKHHQVIKSSPRTMEYWYETSSATKFLTRNFRKMLDHLNIRGGVSFSGNKYRVEKYSLMSK